MKISDFIGEATEYDKKEMLEERRPRSWLKSVSAFANGIGGALIFGVSDEEILVGLTDARAVSEKISETIKTRVVAIRSLMAGGSTSAAISHIKLPAKAYGADSQKVAYTSA